jgi:hypothetical protein
MHVARHLIGPAELCSPLTLYLILHMIHRAISPKQASVVLSSPKVYKDLHENDTWMKNVGELVQLDCV